jgi:hypothetical protein
MAPDDWEARTSLVEEEVDEEVMVQEDGGARMRTRAALQGRLSSGGGLERTAHTRGPAGEIVEQRRPGVHG